LQTQNYQFFQAFPGQTKDNTISNKLHPWTHCTQANQTRQTKFVEMISIDQFAI
jgi:hypothetical protein